MKSRERRPHSRRSIWLAAVAGLAAGCSASRQSGGVLSLRSLDDPFSEGMESVNAAYAANPVSDVATAIGNYVLGGALGTPIAILVGAPIVLVAPGASEVLDGIYAVSGYVGGAILGSPFLALTWLLYEGPRRLIAPAIPGFRSSPGGLLVAGDPDTPGKP